MIASKENKKQVWDLAQKASGILKPLRNEPLNPDGSIRSQLINGLDTIEEYLRIVDSLKNEFESPYIPMNIMNLSFYLRNASKEEFQYTFDRLTEWKNTGYMDCNNALALMLTSELSKGSAERRLDLTDREYVDIITKCNATFGSSLSKMLYNPAVREYYIKKANEGDVNFAFELGTYYYEMEEYPEAFNTLKVLEDNVTAQYLGLMYYYGRGTEPNNDLAIKYLERFNEAYWPKDYEVAWILGDLYAQRYGKRKQYELYLPLLKSPYRDDNDPFLKKMLRQCMLYHRKNITEDEMILDIDIKSDNHACEFSLDLAPYCHIIVDWGDGTCDRYGDLDETGTVICRHIYAHSGSYSLSIESLWESVVEGLDFSRNKRQLHSIYLNACPGLRRLSIVGQCLTSLDLTPGEYQKGFLKGAICRDNMLKNLDLRHCPNITHLDCSFNPITSIKLPGHSSLSVITLHESLVGKSKIDELLKMNQGCYCGHIEYNDLSGFDMRLEFYFRQANWDKVRRYIRKHQPACYDHQLAECELAFQKLKELSQEPNHNPYENRGGFLAVHDSYVSDDTILHQEEFFIKAESWPTCLSTKVRDQRRREPWMGLPPTPPEYYVANCLVNMIKSWREIKIKPVLQNETGND